MPLEAPPPTLRLTVDTEALAHNWRYLDALSGPASAGAAATMANAEIVVVSFIDGFSLRVFLD